MLLPHALLLLCAIPLAQELPAPPVEAPQVSVEDEVLGNIQDQPLGSVSVRDLSLPEPFLRRFADRVIRSTFEDRMRIVIDDSGLEPGPRPAPQARPPSPESTPASAPKPSWFTPLRIAGLCVAAGAVAVLLWMRGRKA